MSHPLEAITPQALTAFDHAVLRALPLLDVEPAALTPGERLAVGLGEKSDDDHFYGPWKGGGRAAGGFPANEETEDLYRNPDGTWDPARARVHEGYFDSVMESVPVTDEPTVYMTGGGPASGKTSGLLENPAAGIPGKGKAAHIDPDSAKTHLPEYKLGVKNGNKGAASYVHEESSYMAKAAMARTLGSGRSVVYDSVGDSGIAKLSAKVAEMRAAGAKRVEASYATVDVKEAIRRSDLRAMKTGRFVPHAFIEQAHRDVAQTTKAAIDKGIFDSLKVFDTTGKPPKLIATAEGSKLTIKDQKAWASFLERGA